MGLLYYVVAAVILFFLFREYGCSFSCTGKNEGFAGGSNTANICEEQCIDVCFRRSNGDENAQRLCGSACWADCQNGSLDTCVNYCSTNCYDRFGSSATKVQQCIESCPSWCENAQPPGEVGAIEPRVPIKHPLKLLPDCLESPLNGKCMGPISGVCTCDERGYGTRENFVDRCSDCMTDCSVDKAKNKGTYDCGKKCMRDCAYH